MPEFVGTSFQTTKPMNLSAPENEFRSVTDEYVQLQLHIFKLTALIIAIGAIVIFFFFGSSSSLSLMVGGISGIIYLRLLARSIGQLGRATQSVSKVQLLIPVILVLVVSKSNQLELLPALLGFLLYKPSLIIQFMLPPRG